MMITHDENDYDLHYLQSSHNQPDTALNPHTWLHIPGNAVLHNTQSGYSSCKTHLHFLEVEELLFAGVVIDVINLVC